MRRCNNVSDLVELGMGAYVLCGRKADGSVTCWGKRRGASTDPYIVPLDGKATKLAVGSYGAAVVLDDGTVNQWWIEQDGAATLVEGARDIATLSCSGSHCCAIDKAGQATCWGSNANGQLGTPIAGPAARASARYP